MVFKYCPHCGNKAILKQIGDDGNIPYCTECCLPLFSLSYSCVLTLVIDENQNFALIRQNNIPAHVYIGVAGYPKQGETFENAVKREVFEEIGLTVNKTRYINSYYFQKKDMIMLGFVSDVSRTVLAETQDNAHSHCRGSICRTEFKLSKEVDEAKWFTKEEAKKVLPENSIVLSLFNDYLVFDK